MAVQTIYILGSVAVTPNWWGNTQLNGSAPTAANSAFGWTAAKTAPPAFWRGRLGATVVGTDTVVTTSYNAGTSGPTKGTGTTGSTAGDSFIAGPFTGIFAATAWTLNFNMRAGTAGAVGHINCRIWKSANANGTSATQLMANTAGVTITLSTTADTNSSISWSPGALTFNNEYLFFQVEWQETTAGSSNSDNVFFHIGTASITTPNLATAWQGAASLAGAGGLAADATISPAGGPVVTNIETLLHFDGVNGSQVFTDATGHHTWTAQSVGAIDTSQSKFGSSSVHFIYSGDRISGDGTIAWGTNDFTIDFWIKLDGTQSGQVNLFSLNYPSPNAILYIPLGGTLQLYVSSAGGAVLVGTTAVTTSAWHHVALTRQAGLHYLFLDGNLEATWNSPTTDFGTAAAGFPCIGDGVNSPVAWVDEFHIQLNSALWTSNFSPPTSAYTLPQSWQGTALLAGIGAFSINEDQWFAAASTLGAVGALSAKAAIGLGISTALAGAGTFTGKAIQWLIANTGTLLAVGNLTAQVQTLRPITLALAGAGTASWPTVDPIDQLLVVKATSAGTGSQSSTLSVLLGTTSALSGAGAAGWQITDPIDQLMAASSILAGSGALVGDVTRLVAAGILWQAVLDPWAGASTFAAQAAAFLPAFSSMAGAATLAAQAALGLPAKAAFSGAGAASWSTVDPIDQWLAANSALAGAGASTSSLLTLEPVATALSGVGTQLASFTARMPSAATLAGASTLASSLGQALLSSATWAGASSALSSLAQQLSTAAPFTGAGTLTGDAPVLRAASAAFAGSSILNAASAQWLAASVATIGGAGLLTAAPIQWQNIAALASGTGALGGDVYIPGHNNWSAVLQVWPATGSLTATTTARLGAGPAPWAAASTLAGALTALAPINAAAAGVGQLASATSSLQLATNASWSGAGALAANYWQLLTITGSVLTGLVGGLATTPAQWMSATSALSGAGAIVGDITKLTGGQLRPIDAVVYPGLSALTAQTTQLLQGLTAWSGAGALSPPPVSVIEPVTLSPAGLGSMASAATLRMSAVFAAAGVGSLTSDVARFTPGIQQGTAALAGASLLVAASGQSMAATLALAGQGTAIGRLAQGMAAGAFWSGAGALLSAEGLRLQARSVLAGSGLLQVDVLMPRGLAALFAATSSLQASSRLLGSLVATQAGASSLAAKTTGVLATQSLLSSTGQLTAGLTAFEQIAGTLAAAGYSAAYLSQLQLLRQQILFGTGVLGANLIQTSIRVVTATIIGRPSESTGIIGRKLTAVTVTGHDPRAGVAGRKPTATIIGQDPQVGVVGQGDFVTLH